MENSISLKDLYFVAVKAFLEHSDRLLICRDRYGAWDIPGGRLQRDEFDTPLKDVLRRKLKEELGEDITYDIGAPLVFMRHERVEAVPGSPTVRIFAIGYGANFLGGAIRLSPQHVEAKWAPLQGFNPSEYFAGGWLKGVREYLDVRMSAAG